MVIATLWTNKERLPEVSNRTDIIALRTFGPQAFRSFLFFGGGSSDAFFQSLKPAGLGLFSLAFFSSQVRVKIFKILIHQQWLISYKYRYWRSMVVGRREKQKQKEKEERKRKERESRVRMTRRCTKVCRRNFFPEATGHGVYRGAPR